MRKVFISNGISVKPCSRCKAVKPLEDFYKQPVLYDGHDGRYSRCKDCIKAFTKSYRQSPTYKSIHHRYYVKHKDRLKSEMAIRRSDRKYKDRATELVRLRKETDPEFGLLLSLRSRIGAALKNNSKSKTTEALVGCPIDDLVNHLGFTVDSFKIGMSIDHIIPCELFDLSKPEHQHACFNWKNLRLISLIENQEKNDRLPDGRSARDLSREDKDKYLIEIGYGYLFR